MPQPRDLHCSFCGKSEHDVQSLIAGPSVFICDACVDICVDILGSKADWRDREIAHLERLRRQAEPPVQGP